MKPTLGLLFLAATLTAQTPVRVEDSDPAVIKNGNWETVTDPAASGGTFIRTTNAAAGASVTLRFTGDTIRIFRQVLNSGGQATVTIDGQPWGTIRFDFAETRMGAPVVIDGLGAGPHVLVMTVSPNRPIFSQQDPVSISFDAFETPVTFTPTAEQTAALTRYNQIRAAAGYPAARLSIPLSLAAQSHSDYMTQNNRLGAAEEQNGQPGFTGPFGADRLRYVGYPGTAYESLAALGDPVAAVESWMGRVRDRIAMMSPGATEVGYGVSRLANRLGDTMMFSIRTTPRPARRVIVTYPAANQTGVPTVGNGNLRIPVASSNALGFPISLHIQSVPGGAERRPLTGTLTGPNNSVIPVTLVSEDNYPLIRDADNVFMIPNEPLAAGTTYTARMTGSDGGFNPYEVTWSFTTASNAAILDPRVIESSATSVTIQWSTLGTVASTSLQYGLTTNYGAVAPAAFNNDPAKPNQWAVRITGLTGNTQYNYRISATDAAGTQTTPNLIFTTPPAAQPVLYAGIGLRLLDFRWTLQGDNIILAAGPGTSLTLTDLNGGLLVNGDPVTLQVPSGRFITVGAGDVLQATATVAGPNETFTVESLAGRRFKAANGRYVSAPAPNAPLVANAAVAGDTEVFLQDGGGDPVTIVTSARFVRNDTVVRGNWKGAFGAEGYQVIADKTALPTYVTVTPSGHQTHTWFTGTGDPRLLFQAASVSDRIASCWYSATSFSIELNFNDAVPHQVAAYMLDWDRLGRSQRVDVLDGAGAVLDTREVTNFQNGQYIVWNLQGRVTLRFTNTAAPNLNLNAVLGGLFFGSGGTATFLGRDSNRSGNWKGAYGGDGFEVLGDNARLPNYVSLTTTGAQTFTWPDSTDDRYPQRAYLAEGNRIAAAWGSATTFNIDVAFTDGQPHRLTLYMLDVDDKARTQRVELLEANGTVLDTREVANLVGGAYLSWTVTGRVTVRVTNNNPATNAVVQALFFGPASPAAGPGLITAPVGRWQEVDGALRQAAAASDGTFVGATEATTLFQRFSTGWVQLPGLASLITASSATRMFASNGGDLFVFDGAVWTQLTVPEGVVFTWLSAATDGTLMAVDTQGRIQRRDPASGAWTVVGTGATRVAVRNFGEFYYLDPTGGVGRNWGGRVTQIGAILSDISVTASGELWGVNPDGNLFQWNGATIFNGLSGRLTQLVVGNSGTMYGLLGQQVWRFQ